LEDLITSGAVVWIVLAVMAVEAVVLARLIKSFPGILASLTNKGPIAIAVCLGVSFLFHLAELYFWFKASRDKVSS
jgi:hypothetical protein